MSWLEERGQGERGRLELRLCAPGARVERTCRLGRQGTVPERRYGDSGYHNFEDDFVRQAEQAKRARNGLEETISAPDSCVRAQLWDGALLGSP